MKQFRTILILLCAIATSLPALASHNRAGEIIYQRIDSNPFRYQITIITYTKTGGQSDDADRCFLTVHFGDGESDEVYRVNGPAQIGVCNHMGEQIATNTKKNIYRTTHTYPGAGIYKVYMQDQNRNAGVKNVPNSDNVWFYIESEIVIDVNSGGNSAPILLNPPIDNGCVDQVYYHNPGAVDPDGDSLVYSIVASKTMGGASIPGFEFPHETSNISSTLEIDSRTGTLIWDSPRAQGEYNLAIRIEEWRYNNNSGALVFVGSTLRDMQIDISICQPKEPPVIGAMQRQCIEAGKQLFTTAIATDADGNDLEMTAAGIPLLDGEGGFLTPDDTVNGSPPLTLGLTWNTRCDHVQFQPYWVYFKAKEDIPFSTEELVDFETLEIQVIPPPVTITNIQPAGASLLIEWSSAPCPGADGYEVYRFNDSLGYEASACNTGVPAALGYEFIAKVDGAENTSFLDDDAGVGLVHGQQYCYMIVVTYPDRSESYPSAEECGELIRDVPILNKVSVNSTDPSAGSDSIAWYKPIDLNTEEHAPPYRYQLSRKSSGNAEFEVVYTSDPSDDILSLDTVVVDPSLNTEDLQHTYRVELLSGPEASSVGKSRDASSIFLTSTPSDNTLTLTWNVDVPWENQEFILYKYKSHPDSTDVLFELARTSESFYVDENLANLKPYRYLLKSVGRYSSDQLNDTLINWSQLHVGIPEDNEAPCSPPGQLIVGDCNLDEASITWSNPNNTCDDVDDVLGYRVYQSTRLGEVPVLMEEIGDPQDTSITLFNGESIAGCYIVTAIDSFGNESEVSEALCIDNCPYYELPNVFTPGSDNINDLFTPFPYKFIESVDISIFNRWGVEVYQTTDPDVNWDGTVQSTGKPAPDGAYFYSCIVNEIRLVGIVQREIKGSFSLLRENTDHQNTN